MSKSPGKRSLPLSRLGASLLAGLLLTIAAAWIPAAFLDITTGKLHPLEYEHPPAEIPSYIDVPRDWHLRTWHACWGPGLRYDLVSECQWMGSTLGMSPSTAPNRTLLRMTAGFPLPCMQWTNYADPSLPPGAASTPWYMGIDLPGKQLIGQRVERALPLRPVPQPFLINTAINTLLVFALLSAVAAWKTARRRRRGLCIQCGYSVGPLGTCPECGSSVESNLPDRQAAQRDRKVARRKDRSRAS